MTAFNPNDTASPNLGTERKALVLRHELVGFWVFASDFIVIVTCGVIAEIVSTWISRIFFSTENAPPNNKFFMVPFASAIIFALVLNLGREHYYQKSLTDKNSAASITLSWLITFLVLAIILFSFDTLDIISKEYIEIFFILGLTGILSSRLVWQHVHRVALNRGLFAGRRILAICEGDTPMSAPCIAELRRYGHMPVDTLNIPTSDIDAECIRALVQRTKAAARHLHIDEIVVAIPIHRLALVARIVEELRALPLPVRFAVDDTAADIIFRPSQHFGHTLSFQVQQHPLSLSERAQKRALDIVVASSALIVLAPAMLMTALAIKLDSVGPALFKQFRYGANGNLFRILKFRSMTVMEDGPDFRQARKEDLRVTRVGRTIRRHSIDELPQLWNVLRGEMSIVGPRPHAVAHDDAYEDQILRYATRRFMKPGLTGWAQVNGSRGETPTTESMMTRLQYDLWYMANWSLWLDITIIVKTIMIVVKPKDTY